MSGKATMQAESKKTPGTTDDAVEAGFDVKTFNPLEEMRKQAEMAYTTYLGAQQKVARAYRERERAEVLVYKETERDANKTCDDAIDAAASVRSAAERKAREEYEKALDAAQNAYRQSVAEALRSCRETIDRQWQVSNDMSEQIWKIFQGANGA